MQIMWKLLGVIFMNFAITLALRNESFAVPDIIQLLRAKTSEGVGETCKEHLKEYMDGVMNKKDWALQMIDSMTKFPDGVLLGHFVVPGHFDECVNAVNDKFSGKHCMAKLLLPLDLQDKQKQDGEKNKIKFTYGICVPSTCTASDIENAIVENLENLEGWEHVRNFTQIREEDCSTSEFRSFRAEDWATVGVITAFCLLAAGSTAYELFQKFKVKNANNIYTGTQHRKHYGFATTEATVSEKPNQLWSSFSLYSNGQQLFRISQSTAQLKCLHGIRFFSMCWVILGHAYFSYALGPTLNLAEMPKIMKLKSFVPVSNAFVSVDSFFFLSGLLVCLVFFRDISKKGSFDVPVAFIHRYLRLTPPFALLMLIQATIISRMGNGPFWNSKMDAVENACRESWWSGLLYVQNYQKPMSTCLGQAWYLSADMQMFWISPLILYPLLWFPAVAPYFILLLVLAAALTNFAIAFVNHLGPNLFTNLGEFTTDQFKLDYAPFHTRMAPWLIGLATGYIICGLQAKKIRLNLSKFWAVVGWAAAGTLLGGSLFGVIRFLSSEYSQAEASLYLAFHRVGWGLGLSWVVVACVGGYGGLINDFLSLDLFQPLAKLSYCNFLIHMILQNYKMNSSRLNVYMRHFDVVYGYVGDLFLSNLISIPITLLFEFPFTRLDRHFLQRLVIFPFPKPKKKTEEKVSDEKCQKPESLSKDLEAGKVNPSFVES